MGLFLQESQAAQRQILMEFLKEARRNKREVGCVLHAVHLLDFKYYRSMTGNMTFFSCAATGAITERTELFRRGHKECSGKSKLLSNGIGKAIF